MHFRIMQRTFPLRTPFVASRWTVTQREVVYVEIRDGASGLTGIGEAAPFEAFGTESLPACLDALRTAAAALTPLPATIDEVRETLAAIPCLPAAPCAAFAIETALLDLLARRAGVSLGRLLAGADEPLERILVNAVLGAGDPESAARGALQALKNGYTCLKMKIGRASLAEDVDAVAAVRQTIGNAILLRLDANGAWDRNTAAIALNALEPFDIEYVEQPVPAHDTEALREVTAHSPVPVAADEALASVEHARGLLEDGAADVFILKPMALGSLLACRDFAIEAQAAWKDVVFTSLIDSAVARRAVAHLAASLPSSAQRHHGLATGDLFASDLASDPIEHGCFALPGDHGLGLALPASDGAAPQSSIG
jgi:L-Ala-D/L-Glu epimerase